MFRDCSFHRNFFISHKILILFAIAVYNMFCLIKKWQKNPELDSQNEAHDRQITHKRASAWVKHWPFFVRSVHLVASAHTQNGTPAITQTEQHSVYAVVPLEQTEGLSETEKHLKHFYCLGSTKYIPHSCLRI